MRGVRRNEKVVRDLSLRWIISLRRSGRGRSAPTNTTSLPRGLTSSANAAAAVEKRRAG